VTTTNTHKFLFTSSQLLPPSLSSPRRHLHHHQPQIPSLPLPSYFTFMNLANSQSTPISHWYQEFPVAIRIMSLYTPEAAPSWYHRFLLSLKYFTRSEVGQGLISIFGVTFAFFLYQKLRERLQEREAMKLLNSGADLNGIDSNVAEVLKERGYSLNRYERILAMDALIEKRRTNASKNALSSSSVQQSNTTTTIPQDQDPEPFTELGGMRHVKEALIRALIFPMRHPHLFKNRNSLRQFPKGILLHGPPGTGKTTLARVVAKSCQCAFIHVRKEILGQKYLGEGEKMTAAIFSLARKLAPAIIFIDEVESIFPNRAKQTHSHRVHELQMSIMLENWDGFRAENKIMILGATNLASSLDPAALRRFQYKFKVGLPNEQERLEILKILLRHDDVHESFDYERVARLTEGLSGSDMKDILQEAILLPINEAMDNGSSTLNALTTEHVMIVWKRRRARS